jgi:ankyrin repeat protein
LLEAGAEIDPVCCEYGLSATPLQWAAAEGTVEVVSQLLEAGASIGGTDCSALHMAVLGGRKEMVSMILAAGADANAKVTAFGGAPLGWVGGDSADAREIAEMLIDAGADVNSADDNNKQTVLHSLVGGLYPVSLDVIKLLIEKGANVNTKDKKGRTALHIAAQSGNIEVVEMLLEMGLDPSERDQVGSCGS